MSAPGPEATHSSSASHARPGISQTLPDFWHLGPLMLGLTSPKLDDANAATKRPCAKTRIHYVYRPATASFVEHLTRRKFSTKPAVDRVIFRLLLAVGLTFPIILSGFIFCSNNTEAYPMLSDDTSLLVLFILVACTAYQLITPSGVPVSLSKLNWTITLSTLSLYLHEWKNVNNKLTRFYYYTLIDVLLHLLRLRYSVSIGSTVFAHVLFLARMVNFFPFFWLLSFQVIWFSVLLSLYWIFSVL